jgi:hypothetical protein
MKALIPHRFGTGDVLSGTEVNTNLRAIARDVGRSQARRYTYCSVIIPIDGVVDTDTAAERTVPFPRPVNGANAFSVDVVGVELSIYAATGATWTATVTDENSRTVVLSVVTAGALVEAYDASNVPLQISSAADLRFVLSASAANTVVRGYLTLHCRMDRHQQDATTLTAYTPGLVSASTSTAGSVLDTELTAAQAAVTSDEGNDDDMRCVCVMANDLAATQTWRLPSGAGCSVTSLHAYVVGSADSLDVDILTSEGSQTVNAAATGTANVVSASSSPTATRPDDPTDTADDVTLSLIPTGATVSRAFGFLWLK